MPLEKAKIIPYTDDTLQKKDSAIGDIDVLFNPQSYSISVNNSYGSDEEEGGTKTTHSKFVGSPKTQYTGRAKRTLSMNLFFDTYDTKDETKVNVMNYTDKILALLGKDNKTSPPVCKFVWGKFTFVGMVQSVTQNFIMFLDSGIPVRAKVDISMQSVEIADSNENSSDGKTMKVRGISEAEKMCDTANEEYGDPTKWKKIAQENKVANPRVANKSTSTLKIPPQR